MTDELQLYRQLFDASPRPMWVFDRESLRIVLVNDAATKLYGWSREELLAMTLRDLRPASEQAAFAAAYAAEKGSPTYSRVGRHCKKTGELIEVHLELTRLAVPDRAWTLSIVTDVTGIADAERRFRLLVEHSADAIALVDEHHVIEYVSPAGYRILGRTHGESLGRDALMALHPEDRTAWVPPRPGETKTNLARLRHADGSWRWIESSTTNQLHDPAVRAYVSNYRDVTERKLAERAMLETQRRLEYLLSATSAVTYTARATGDGGATFISANVQDVLGYTPAEFCSDPAFWRTHVHPEDLPEVEAQRAHLLKTGAHSTEYRFRHRDGTYRWMRVVARVTRDDAGQPHEIVGYWIDFTEQQRAAAALRESERNFRALIERSPAATLVHRGGRVVYANAATVALLGYDDANELIGGPVLDLVHPDDRDGVRHRIEQGAHAGSIPPGECRMLRCDGSTLVVEVEAIVLDLDGQPSYVVIARDVTERRELFARMAMADRMLTVGTLAAGVAHEINNPLAYAATNLEVLAAELPRLPVTTSPRGDLQAMVADAREGVARVSAIVRELRALARPEGDARGPVDVESVLASSIKMAHNELRHRARVVTAYAPALPRVHAHPSRLGQVFLNLLLNAAHAIRGPAEDNEIRVRTGLAADREHVHVEIEDTGTGMTPAIMRRIFDPFFTTKAPGAGMGLGLAISHQIVRELDGQIAVDSRPGGGSTFRVLLPVDHSALPDAAPVPHRTECTRARVLLIDDEAAIGRSLQALLAGDHEIVPVTHVADGLELLRSGEPFDLILCDLMMPGLSGIDLYERLGACYQQRIIFMTGGAFTPQAREFLELLGGRHLEKPFTELQVRDVLERTLRSLPS